MLEIEVSLADLVTAVQDASENDAQVLAALIHLLLGDESGVALGA
jgi:hypothetical protein